MDTDQDIIDATNANFWNELCGTQLAKSLGVTDTAPSSLKRFDDWYLAFYPYLERHIPFGAIAGKDVLEVGLGYGTVAQKLAQAGARYRGLDIAQGPVDMTNLRMRQNDLNGAARRGSVLAAPFEDASFDVVVAIGCLHHTGDLRRAIDECRRMLRRGGQLIFMVYSAFSYRRWRQEPQTTIDYLVRELAGHRGVVGARNSSERAQYDTNAAGEAAPQTDWISVRSLRWLCRDFASFSATRENIEL